MVKRLAVIAIILITVVALVSCNNIPEPAQPSAPAPAEKADLTAIKDYLIEHGGQMAESTAAIKKGAESYFEIIKTNNFNYEAAWNSSSEELKELLFTAKHKWILAHNNYELVEGIVAGVPSLAYYDTWIDAGPSAEEDPAEAVNWILKLDDGRIFESPGNIFHTILETTLWGTVPDYTGKRVDLDGDGESELGEVLPEAYILLAAARVMDGATTEMNSAIAKWEPTLKDSFTALLTMIPTMGEYFEEWKLSAFIVGDDPRFVAQTRLVDIKGIATSLDVIYSHLSPTVAENNQALDEQIETGFDDLLSFLDEVYTQEQVGVQYTPEEADSLGTEAQNKAQTLAARVAQAASALGLKLEL